MAVLDLKSLRVDSRFFLLPEIYYSRVAPEPLKNPHLVAFNSNAARLIDIDPRGVSSGAHFQTLVRPEVVNIG
ncbi:MAG: hypothetical protein V7731_12460 [Amphritea sp.]